MCTKLKYLALVMMSLSPGMATADTIIDNVLGYTLIGTQLQQFQALAFDDAGKIIATGKSAELAARLPMAKRVDGGGKTLLPGMIDAHGHVLSLGASQMQLGLRATANLAEAQKTIADYARRFPLNQWIIGGEWNQANWKLGRFPTAQEIDAVVKDRPVWLSRVDGHAGWANSKALQLAGITENTPDPSGGKIEKDAHGKPTGILIDAAMSLVSKVVPPASNAEQRTALDLALLELAKVGVTSVHDAGVSESADKLFREYADKGKLTTRIYGMLRGTDGYFDKVSLQGPLLTYGQDFYSLRAVKLFADGALGSRGAALMAPYSDAPHTHGLLFKTTDEMHTMIEKAASKGYQVNVHAIGDAGNHQMLDGFARLPATSANLRHRIEHAQVVALDDIPRFKQLGILPSMQPTHATSDMNMAEDRVGAERIKGAYAWRSFLQQGSRIACGSDFPIESPNPFWGVHAAVTRQDMAGKPAQGWYVNQAMTVQEALRCFTLDAAYAAHQENTLGTLEAGKWADFILIDQDMLNMPAKDIYKIKVLQTWVAGKQVYSATR
ncbi:amidohydrolase [Undibacterium sp. NL8W]|uniref:Amidohydrolase n=2 Tax=Undibacterium umbellatum TaxID=2762300 RepID=A0ABR6ZEF7_9BURK|nr:amidohydrolase [Undibacterium umbellatum]